MEPATSLAPQFNIRTEAYEGPLSVLLDLIESRKFLVNDISLSQVTDDFIAYVRGKGEFPIEDAADFIQMAATLLLIKSKSLIPDLELSGDEEQDIDDLKRRLEAYEKAREAARELSRIFGRQVMVSAGERAPEPVFAPSKDLTLANLERALQETLAAMEKEQELPEHRVRPMVTIEEMMDRLLNRVQTALTLSFKEFSGDAKERVEVIVSFLAMLELVKQGAIDVAQHETYGDIHIKNLSTDTPRY